MYITQNMICSMNLIRDRITAGTPTTAKQREFADKVEAAIKKDPSMYDAELRSDHSVQFRSGSF